MKSGTYSIYDTASGLFSTPFLRQRDAEAIRDFDDLIADGSSKPSTHPEDFALVRIANFNDGTGDYENEHNVTLRTGLASRSASRQIVKDLDEPPATGS